MRNRSRTLFILQMLGKIIPPLHYFREVIKRQSQAVKTLLKATSQAHKLTLYQKPRIEKEDTL